MPESLQVGLLSCGGMARTLAHALNRLPRARIARVCDVVESAASAFGQELGVPWTTEAAQVLADPEIGAVIVATPNFTHADLVVQAAQAGKHVFCEKPMALSVADCDRMIAATTAAGVHLCVGHVLRYLPVFDRMRRLIDEGAIGSPFAMRVVREGGWGAQQSWRQQRALCGGPLFEIHAHELDYMRFILGEPETVYATSSQRVVTSTDFEDTAFVSIRFAGGAHAVLHATVASALGGYTGEIQGTEGTIRFTNWPSRIEWRRIGAPRETRATVIEDPELTAPDAHERELGHLVDAALDGVRPPIGGADGRAVVAMAEAAVRSMGTGQPVTVSARGPGAAVIRDRSL